MAIAGSLLAVADKLVNEQAVALSPTIGWLLLACAVCVALIFAMTPDRWRRWWLTMEDPRSMAVFRIVFTFFVICNINGMWEYFEYLYTDEGIFTADVARQVHASSQFRGFGDGFGPDDPWGFFDVAAFAEFLKGPRYSLLFFWDSPAFFWGHLVAFEVCALCLMVGFRTRLMAVLTWFLMNSILVRNHLGWEGTELVYRCFMAYLVFARSGHAYSVDNWLRCRRLRRQGLLSGRDGPGGGAGIDPDDEHPKGLQAVYRLIPAWPRRLMMLQLATIYITTGTLKTGSVWINGDSLYYALNLDHFYRFPPQLLSSLAGTTVFRAMTWAVKVGQTGFVLIILGLIVKWLAQNKFPALRAPQKWGMRAAFAGLIATTASVIYVAWPVHFTPPVSAELFVGLWIGLWVGLWGLWYRLGSRPLTVSGIGRWRLREPAIIDRLWVSRWVIGRRVLLVWHIAFHAHIFTLMNVGQFQTGMLSATFVFLEGREIASLLRAIGRRLAKWRVPFVPRDVALGLGALPAEDPALAHHRRDTAQIPVWAILVTIAIIVVGVIVRVHWDPQWGWRWVWVVGVVFLGGVAFGQARARRHDPASAGADPIGAPWAYGPLGRFVVGAAIVWHLAAVATWLLPAKDSLSTFRAPARQVFSVWLTRTTTDQGWGMFAPNPPRSNVFLKVLVTDQDGEVWDLRTDVYAEERKPMPWIWNTRLRKMNRRIIGGESGPNSWYRKWHARYHCRLWAREHGGEPPQKVELVKIWYKIPAPDQTRARGYYVPEDLLERSGHEKVSHTEHCERAVMGQLPNFIRARDGLPLLEPGVYRPWKKGKKSKWERTRKRREDKRDRVARTLRP